MVEQPATIKIVIRSGPCAAGFLTRHCIFVSCSPGFDLDRQFLRLTNRHTAGRNEFAIEASGVHGFARLGRVFECQKELEFAGALALGLARTWSRLNFATVVAHCDGEAGPLVATVMILAMARSIGRLEGEPIRREVPDVKGPNVRGRVHGRIEVCVPATKLWLEDELPSLL